MKLSSMILLSSLVLLIGAMFLSNVLLKKEYQKIDKNDRYWNYGRIVQEPFRHLNINGGNETSFVFEESDRPGISILKNWEGYVNNVVKAFVRNDTLFVNFELKTTDNGELDAIKRMTMVRISSAQLLSITLYNNNLILDHLTQKSLTLELKGRSSLLLQSSINRLEALKIHLQDSSKLDLRMATVLVDKHALPGTNTIVNERGGNQMFVGNLNASVSGVSLLDFSHAQIDSLKLSVADTSGLLLSGLSLKKMK